MPARQCPGQNPQFWKPEDIFVIRCPSCRAEVEFWKDDAARQCDRCHLEIRNPKIDLGCAKWCKYAGECLGLVEPEAKRSQGT